MRLASIWAPATWVATARIVDGRCPAACTRIDDDCCCSMACNRKADGRCDPGISPSRNAHLQSREAKRMPRDPPEPSAPEPPGLPPEPQNSSIPATASLSRTRALTPPLSPPLSKMTRRPPPGLQRERRRPARAPLGPRDSEGHFAAARVSPGGQNEKAISFPCLCTKVEGP